MAELPLLSPAFSHTGWRPAASRASWRVESPLRGVALWAIDLDHPLWPQHAGCLDATERQRAQRLLREDLRRRFVAARCALREILALATSQDAAELQLSTAEHGKPRLLGLAAPLYFNLSHSGGMALLALSRVAPVGVDIEMRQPIPDVEALALEHLTAAEWAAFAQRSCSADPAALQRERAFLRLWTRKEACLKAWGCGLQVQPQRVAVGWGEEQSSRIEAPEPGLGGMLRLVSLSMPENVRCEAAVALGLLSTGTGCSTRQQET